MQLSRVPSSSCLLAIWNASRAQVLSLRNVFNHNYRQLSNSTEHELDYTQNQTSSFSLNREGSHLSSATRTHFSPAAVSPDVKLSPQNLRPYSNNRWKGNRLQAGKAIERSNAASCQTALSDTFFLSYTKAEGRLKKAIYRFIETVLINILDKRTLEEVWDHKFERCTHSVKFMDVFAAHKLSAT